MVRFGSSFKKFKRFGFETLEPNQTKPLPIVSYYSKVNILDELWSEKNAWRKVGLYGTIIIIMLSGVKKGENFHCSGVRERYNHISL